MKRYKKILIPAVFAMIAISGVAMLKETHLRPKTMSLAEIIENGKKAAESWTGLDPSKYSDLSFYDADGTAHIKGKVNDYTTLSEISSVSLITYDDFTGRQFPHTASIAPDGSFEMDVQVKYPQFTSLDFGESHENSFLIPDGERHNYICLIPGDTISISTCMASHMDRFKGMVPEYFGFDGTPTESTVISLLADSLINKRYGFDSLFWRQYDDDMFSDPYSIASDTYKTTEKLCTLLDSIVSDLPVLLGDLPVSSFAKDVLSAYAVGQIQLLMEHFDLLLRIDDTSIVRLEDGSLTFEPDKKYDITKIISPQLRHKDLLYDNPLSLCISGILTKRWKDNETFNPAKWAAIGMRKSSNGKSYHGVKKLSEPFNLSYQHLDSLGLGNCFATQVVQTRSFIEEMHTISGNPSKVLGYFSRILPYITRYNTSDVLNSIVMQEYNDFVKDVVISENALDVKEKPVIIIEGNAEEDTLEKIIAPYRGNVLFLDFWGISCAPCRAGMVRQKPLLEELTDKPFKAIYIANTEDGVETCKRWLRKEGIKGEHVFVSEDAWQSLRKRFNIYEIPFGVLIDKDGKVIETGIHDIPFDSPLFKVAISE